MLQTVKKGALFLKLIFLETFFDFSKCSKYTTSSVVKNKYRKDSWEPSISGFDYGYATEYYYLEIFFKFQDKEIIDYFQVDKSIFEKNLINQNITIVFMVGKYTGSCKILSIIIPKLNNTPYIPDRDDQEYFLSTGLPPFWNKESMERIINVNEKNLNL